MKKAIKRKNINKSQKINKKQVKVLGFIKIPKDLRLILLKWIEWVVIKM